MEQEGYAVKVSRLRHLHRLDLPHFPGFGFFLKFKANVSLLNSRETLILIVISNLQYSRYIQVSLPQIYKS